MIAAVQVSICDSRCTYLYRWAYVIVTRVEAMHLKSVQRTLYSDYHICPGVQRLSRMSACTAAIISAHTGDDSLRAYSITLYLPVHTSMPPTE